jgi:signal transduction histidine kinase
VELEHDGERVITRVRDTGMGIPEEELPRIFDRFYQVEKVATRKAGGTGLGLSIVKSIVEALGGTVTVASRVGEGTTFSVALPAADK